jgi:hypothetical protein
MVKVIVAESKLDCEHLLGQYLDESHFDTVINEDTDCYMEADCGLETKVSCDKDCSDCDVGADERRIAFKFRKNWFTKEEQDQAYIGLREAATESQNRGLAAGPRGEMLGVEGRGGRDWVTDYELEVLDYLMDTSGKLIDDVSIESIRAKHAGAPRSNADETRGAVWLRSQVCKVYPEYFGWFDTWVDSLEGKSKEEIVNDATKVANKWISTTNYAKSVFSGVAGWYDRYPRIPFGRATSYTRDNFDKFKLSFPFLQSLDRGFKELLPWRWSNQKSAVDKIDGRFVVPETVFTTITVNKSFRTAAHRDAGDLDDGLSNLLVVGSGDYTGGYLVFPEYRIAVNVRPGDLLLVNNHEIMHGNTEIVLTRPDAERISLVCYFREAMLELGSFEYEQTREQYVVDRRINKEHKYYRPLWNGVSPGMWDDQEWYDYLEEKLGREIVEKYHPKAYEVGSSLEDLF